MAFQMIQDHNYSRNAGRKKDYFSVNQNNNIAIIF
jgi:hypothetical protein